MVGIDGSSSGNSKGIDGGSITNGGESAGARGTSGLGVGCRGVVGGERHPSSCGICLFLVKTAAQLLDRGASLTFFAHFRSSGASCGDGASSGGASCGDWESGCGSGAGCADVVRTVGDVELLAMAGQWLEGRLIW
jgi:hypothetical protein